MIDALDTDGTEVIVTDAVLSVMDGPSDAASAVTGGTPSTVYVHVSSAILAALNGTVALELSTTAGFTDPNGNTVTLYTAGSRRGGLRSR